MALHFAKDHKSLSEFFVVPKYCSRTQFRCERLSVFHQFH